MTTPAAPSTAEARTGDRLALAAFVAVLAGALALYVTVGHRHYWFFQDEWTFLVERDGGSVDGLFRPHNEHWTTVPVIAYRTLWRVFGLRSYLPYQAMVIGLHLTAGVLLRVVMRRAGAGPWISTAAASMFVLLGGAGWQDIVWAFQITFVGSLVCGLAHLLLADHDGPFDRRDAAGLALGLVGLMCSGVAVSMVFVVGLATLVRRGWRLAFLHVVPLATIFAAWWLAFARNEPRGSGSSPWRILQFVANGLRSAFARMAEIPLVSVTLVIVLVVGLVLAWAPLARPERRQVAAMPAALLTGAMVFMAIAGSGRAGRLGLEFAERWRYVHVLTALIAPALAVAAQAIASRWRAATPVLVVLFLVGVPKHIDTLRPQRARTDPQTLVGTDVVGDPRRFFAVAHSPYLDQLEPTTLPFLGTGAQRITVGWLRESLADGRIPDERVSPRAAADAALTLTVQHTAVRLDPDTCEPFEARTQRMAAGDSIDFRGPLLVAVIGEGDARSRVVPFSSTRGSHLDVVAGPVTLKLTPYNETTLEC